MTTLFGSFSKLGMFIILLLVIFNFGGYTILFNNPTIAVFGLLVFLVFLLFGGKK